MLKRLSPRERLEQLVADLTPMLRAAFMDTIDDIRSNIVLAYIANYAAFVHSGRGARHHGLG